MALSSELFSSRAFFQKDTAYCMPALRGLCFCYPHPLELKLTCEFLSQDTIMARFVVKSSILGSFGLLFGGISVKIQHVLKLCHSVTASKN